MGTRRRAARDKWGADRDCDQAVAELRERAAAGIQALVTGEDWAGWLRVAARFPGWSVTNILLIAAQRPGATQVASYEAWKARGRQVRRGEPGIGVIEESRHSPGREASPARRADKPDMADRPARLTHLWDITQTSGPPSDSGVLCRRECAPPALWDCLTWYARREGFAVDRADRGPAASLTNWDTRRISINPRLSQADAAQTLLHELGHVLVHSASGRLPGTDTAQCHGIQKVEADSVAFIVSARLGVDTTGYSWPYVASWAGSDPRARPEQAVRAAAGRITRAAAAIASHVDATLFAAPGQDAVTADMRRAPGADAEPPHESRLPAPTEAGAPRADLIGVLEAAERFYMAQLGRGWAPGYLATRGLSPATVRRWRIGYAPAGWTALVSHLRRLGCDDTKIQAAGLGRRSSRGTLIDHFRDRVMLPIRDEHGRLAGFIGRARSDAGPAVPKYLNSPQTAAYAKGDILFGLYEARNQLARGATPVIVEGPFDAIAVTIASPRQYAGLAPCGTALTTWQAAALARTANLGTSGVLVALDGDPAGQRGAVKAYEVLLTVTSKPTAAIMPSGRDPAQILQAEGTAALVRALQHTEALATVVINAHLESWAERLEYPEGQLLAMGSAATLIARLLPPEAADQILQITSGRPIATFDDTLHAVTSSELTAVARALPTNAICQILRVGELTNYECSDVTAEVANMVSQDAKAPKSAASPSPDIQSRSAVTTGGAKSAQLVKADFPSPLPRSSAWRGQQRSPPTARQRRAITARHQR